MGTTGENLATKTRIEQRVFPNSTSFSTYLRRLIPGQVSVASEETIVHTQFKPPRSNWCSHTKTNAYCYQSVRATHRQRTYRIADVVDSHDQYVPNLVQPYTDVTNESNFLARKEQAITDVLSGGIRPTIDIPLFVAELKDSKHLISTLVDGVKDLKRVQKYVARAEDLAHKMRTGVIPRRFFTEEQMRLLAWHNLWVAGDITVARAADVNLWYKFGLSPLISDIPKLWRCLEGTEIVVRPGNRKGEKVRSTLQLKAKQQLLGLGDYGDKTAVVSATASTGSPVVNSASYIGNVALKLASRRYRFIEHKLTCYGDIVNPFQGNDIIRSLKLGAGSPISIAWQLTRLSFVFDRLLDISTFLDETERRLKALDLGLKFRNGVWISHEYATVEAVPWWTFDGSTLEVLSRTGSSAAYRDTYRYKWLGWQNVSGNTTYSRTALPDVQPKFVIRHCLRPDKLLHLDTDLALLAQFLR